MACVNTTAAVAYHPANGSICKQLFSFPKG